MEANMRPDYILSLDDSGATLDLVGGKGASLSRMANAGLPIPVGFHVTTEAYWHFVEENGLQPEILKAIEAVDASVPETLEAASKTIVELFAGIPIPAKIAGAVVQAYGALPGTSPAVARELPASRPVPASRRRRIDAARSFRPSCAT